MSLSRVYSKDPETLTKIIDNEFVIIPLGEEVGVSDMGVFHILKNETARAIWELIDGKRSVQKIVDSIAFQFHARSEAVVSDITHFLQHLEKIKAIK